MEKYRHLPWLSSGMLRYTYATGMQTLDADATEIKAIAMSAKAEKFNASDF